MSPSPHSRRVMAGKAFAFTCVLASVSLLAADAGNRGLTDSVVSTLAGGNPGSGSAAATTIPLTSLNGGIARDSSGNIYFTEGSRVLQLTPAGALSVFAGSQTPGYSEVAKGAGARFANPTNLTIDSANNIYVWDTKSGLIINNRIRKIAPDGTVTTVAGNGSGIAGSITDIGKPAINAALPAVTQMAVDGSGNLFFISGVSTFCIYEVPNAATTPGVLTLVAGDGTNNVPTSGQAAGGNPLGAALNGIAILSNGSLIYSTDNAIRNIVANVNTVVAGVVDLNPAVNTPQTVSILFPDDGTKTALQTFTSPATNDTTGGVAPGRLAVAGANIYFMDTGSRRIRTFTIAGNIKTVFGEISEGGQTSNGGFRGNGSPAATNTPNLGVVIAPKAGLGLLATPPAALGGTNFIDNGSRPNRIFSGTSNTSSTTATAPDQQIVANASAAPYDGSQRNDDPKLASSGGAGLVAASGAADTVTFVDDGNGYIRQFSVGGNVTTIAGASVPFRIQNLAIGLSIVTQNITDATAVPALGASIFAPSALGKDATGNFYFDAFDAGGDHNIYKLDVKTNPAAPTVAVIAGVALTNGFPTNAGDGGPAANVLLKGLGCEATLAATDKSFLFAEADPTAGTSSSTVRAVSAAGVISTIAGIPGILGSLPTDIDQSLVKATSVDPLTSNPVGVRVPVTANRIGLKPTQVPFRRPRGVIGTDAADFIVADTGNNAIVTVAAGLITQDFGSGVGGPAYLAQSGTFLFVAGTATGRVDKFDLSATPPTPFPNFIPNVGVALPPVNGTSGAGTGVITTAATNGVAINDILTNNAGGYTVGALVTAVTPNVSITVNQITGTGVAATFNFSRPTQPVRGLALGTNGLFVLGSGGQIVLVSTASLATANGVAAYTFNATANTATGLAVNGTTVVFTDRTAAGGLIKQYTDTGAAPLPAAVTTVAGAFTNVLKEGFNLQSHFNFLAFTPLAISGTSFIAGDDGPAGTPIEEFRLVTPVAPAPTSNSSDFAGAGNSVRDGGADGEPALNAADIGNGSPGSVGGIAVDANGAVFFSDQNLNTIRRIANGTITTIAGAPSPAGSPVLGALTDGIAALQATFNLPAGLAFNGADATTIFVADKGNNIVRKITPTDGTGTVTRVAGTSDDGPGAGGDQTSALTARLNNPNGLAFDGNSDMYISEAGASSNGLGARVHVVSKAGTITQVAGGGADSPSYLPLNAFEVQLPSTGICLDASGKIYISYSQSSGSPGLPLPAFVTRVAGGNAVAVVGDVLLSGFNGDGLAGVNTLLSANSGIGFDAGTGLVICDTANNRVRTVTNLGLTGNSPPTAVIVATPDHLGTVPFTVHLDGSTSTDPDGDIVSYAWDFGDGTTGVGPQVDHTYAAMGAYVVTLTVTDTAGNVSTSQMTVFSAMPLLGSNTTGKGTFVISYGKKAGNDSFAFTLTNVAGLVSEVGQPFTIFIGPFSASGTAGGKALTTKRSLSALDLITPLAAKPPKPKKSNINVTVDPNKGTIAVSLKSVNLAAAFKTFGVTNSNSIGGRSATVPVVIVFGKPTSQVVGDKLVFIYQSKFNKSANGKFSQ